MQTGIPCTVMRGGTSKGLYFRSDSLPADEHLRRDILLAAMGSPDGRQIDGLGGANPLTSKVAVVGPSSRPDADVDYLFLQVVVDAPLVDISQNCGNILAGVGPFAIEQGMVEAQDPVTKVRIHMVNSQSLVEATIQTPDGEVRYAGDARIDGVPGTAAPVMLDFLDVAGSACGALLPTGNACDEIEGLSVTCVDNGMPVICVTAEALGLTGYETPAALKANAALCEKVEILRLRAGTRMGLGDVRQKTIPKISILAPPCDGGALSTRTFIPHRVHDAIGVFGAVSVATACLMPGSVAARVAKLAGESREKDIRVEHPTGFFDVRVALSDDGAAIERAALLRTARKLMDGMAYVPASIWDGRRTAPGHGALHSAAE